MWRTGGRSDCSRLFRCKDVYPSPSRRTKLGGNPCGPDGALGAGICGTVGTVVGPDGAVGAVVVVAAGTVAAGAVAAFVGVAAAAVPVLAVGVVPPAACAVTVTVPCMFGCTVQWYANVPAIVNVTRPACPFCSIPVSNVNAL